MIKQRSSFSLLEVLLVIVVIGVLSFVLLPKFNFPYLNLAVDQIVKDIKFTQSLALRDDKYQPFPSHQCDGTSEGKIECNKSKYWFKQWWQIRILKTTDNKFKYEIFSDTATDTNSTSFNKIGGPVIEYPYTILNAKYASSAENYSTYDSTFNLTDKFHIKYVSYIINNIEISVTSNRSFRLIFDNFGNIFLNEGEKGDGGDINPIDMLNRPLLTDDIIIRLCIDNPCNLDRCKEIVISPLGRIYKQNCN